MFRIFWLVFALFPFHFAHAASVGWIVRCDFSHALPDDPIVSSIHGASHLHDFIGNRSVNAKSTYNSMLIGGTNCRLVDDSAGYWTPALYKDGEKIDPSKATIYYRRAGEGSVRVFPPDFRMIAGNSAAKTRAENPRYGRSEYWGCSDHTQTQSLIPPNCSTGSITLHVKFPSCWDGVHKDSLDHKSHMAYPASGVCPSTHPVKMPLIIYRWEYAVGTNGSGITLSSGSIYSAHGDFWNTWQQAKFAQLVHDCINANINCGRF